MPILVDERTLTELDHVRLTYLLQRQGATGPATDALQTLLDDAQVVAVKRLPAHVVTMNSRVLVHELPGGACHSMTLAYPAEADVARHRVSVLSPMGTGLLGLRVGDVARWKLPDGQVRQAEVAAIEYQPEAEGDLTR